ncbi:CSC1-like protein 1 [Armadillidium vulgare]|nr:CSC1-like protein 1 [Armadillidium vulgare]
MKRMSISNALDEGDNLSYISDSTFFPNTSFRDNVTYVTPLDQNEDLKCNQYISKNKTHFIYGGYEGIPENLLINFIGWIVLLSLFTVLRKNAWNYGRLALVQKYENRWTHIFYGTDQQMSKPSGTETDSVSSYEFNVHIDKGFFSWIPAVFKIKDEHILAKSGRDAVQYLSFQRHIIVYMMIVCVVCITIILPINFQGTLEGGEKEFGHTTLSNLDPSSYFMWVHVTLAFIFLPLGIGFTRRFSRMLEVRALTTSVSRTLMITRVPRRSCHKDTLLRHFQDAYPNVDVQDIQFAYDIKKLVELDKEREVVHTANIFCESYLKETGYRLEMRAYKCGVICGCCDIFGCPKVDAIEYYTQEEANLTSEVEDEKVKALQHPTGIAFVTFDSIENAQLVLHDHRRRCGCGHNPPSSLVSKESNLSVTTKLWYVKAIFINFLLFIFLFFLTTPPVVINSLDLLMLSDKLTQMSPLLSEFLPTLMLWTVAALMPVIVAYSDQFMSHWTRSGQNHSVMRKTFIFLLFMLIILPSLGFTSAKAFLEWVLHDQLNQNQTYRWECMFLPDNGGFFVNYVITSAFIGTALELIRFPELFLYIIRLGLARSEAETASIRKNILYEFQFGVQYAWMLLIFAMTVIYSVSCPLITPFGLIYLIFKHLVDNCKFRDRFNSYSATLSLVFFPSTSRFEETINHLQSFSPLRYFFDICDACSVPLVQGLQSNRPGTEEVQIEENFDDEIEQSTSEISEERLASYQFVPPVLRSASICGDEGNSRFYPTTRRSYGTNPEEMEINIASDTLQNHQQSSDQEKKSNSQEHDSFIGYQNYTPKVTLHAEINNSPDPEVVALEDEETVYIRPCSSNTGSAQLNFSKDDNPTEAESNSTNQDVALNEGTVSDGSPVLVTKGTSVSNVDESFSNSHNSSKNSTDPTRV